MTWRLKIITNLIEFILVKIILSVTFRVDNLKNQLISIVCKYCILSLARVLDAYDVRQGHNSY